VIVTLAGSWCPNCHDEAALLAEMHRRKRDRGLEVISLMFEQFGDFERAREAVYRFRDRHRVGYTTLVAGISDKDDAASKLPQLNGVYAFPTTIFVDRSGRVRKIHRAFRALPPASITIGWSPISTNSPTIYWRNRFADTAGLTPCRLSTSSRTSMRTRIDQRGRPSQSRVAAALRFQRHRRDLPVESQRIHHRRQGGSRIPTQANARNPQDPTRQARYRRRLFSKSKTRTRISPKRSRTSCYVTESTPTAGRKIVKLIKESELKVQAGIHGDKVRITGKQRDDLQSAIALLRRKLSIGVFSSRIFATEWSARRARRRPSQPRTR
jgi:thiol-disulfide isomerase/thioredoxin